MAQDSPAAETFPITRSFLHPDALASLGEPTPESLEARRDELGLPEFLPDLARAEQALARVHASAHGSLPVEYETLTVNPTLVVLEHSWHLSAMLQPGADARPPEAGDEVLLIWRRPESGRVQIQAAAPPQLLALKLAVEGASASEAAEAGGVPPAVVEQAVHAVAGDGLVFLPTSRLLREGDSFPEPWSIPSRFREVRSFNLQWHLTNQCELHCKHCYDRTQPSPLTLEQAKAVVADLVGFCEKQRVQGSVTLTGGNPFLFKGFMELYEEIGTQTDIPISILGNPTTRQRLERMIAIRKPKYYQVSLEGLEEHNDRIRGEGYFQRVLEFLPLLEEVGIRRLVMLTLTRSNIDQVLPLARRLRGLVNRFTFNRLSEVGEGASLDHPSSEEYEAFLRDYLAASREDPGLNLGQKDNLFNVIRHEHGRTLSGGCTGKGCGAAFNFIAVLPNGDAHACRKFPSPIGNVFEQGIEAVYFSDEAERYRQGSAGCVGCSIRHACGGCMAVAMGRGLDPFAEVDPDCFMHHVSV